MIALPVYDIGGLGRRLATPMGFTRAGLSLAAPIVDLLVRLALAKAFFDPELLDAGSGWQMIFIQLAGPLLLGAGLFVRPVALLALILTVHAQMDGAPRDEHLFWVALFGWFVVQGAGPLSLDRMLAKGLKRSPLPLAARATAAAAWFEREVGPLYRLAVRLWLAVALIDPAVAPTMMRPMMHAGVLPQVASVVEAGLLALGLATPLACLALFIQGFGMTMAGAGSGLTLYGPLLVALLGVFGAGRYSLDWLIGWLLRRQPAPTEDLPHVVIVGAGFGGMACAAGLRHDRVRVTLIDRNNYHLFQPLLYQVATGSLSPGDIAIPIRGAFRGDHRLRVLCGTVSAVDATARTVTVDGQALPYDILVLATGATHSYFGRDDWASDAPGLKSVRDATAIRSRILSAFEQAEATDDAAERRSLLTFLVCGAGPTGVELAGAIAELARHGMAKDFRSFDPASARILLVQSGPRVLPQFDEKLSAFARRSLEDLGVEVRVDSRVEMIDAGGVMVSGERIAAGTVLWAAGVVASPAATWLGVEQDRAGRIKVGGDLSIRGLPDVFAIGDTALSLTADGQPVPGLAPAAKQQGAHVAAVVRARVRGRAPPPPFRYRHQGSLATIGRQSAVVDFGRLKLTGPVAWWLWGAVHILFLGGVRNRFSVILGWVWSYFTFDVGVRLITDESSRRATRVEALKG